MSKMTGKEIFQAFRGTKCLVTGGAGTIGSHLVRSLVEGGAEVTVIDNFTSGHLSNLTEVLPRIRLVRGSITSDVDLKSAFSNKPEYVFHLAAHFANQNSVEHPYSDMMTNAVGTQMILDCARNNPRLRGLVYSSSSCVLGGQSEIMHEDMRPAPETPYGVSKLAGEHYTVVYSQVYNLPAAVVRYFNVFGPNEHPGRYRNVIPNFMWRAIHGESLTITGTGTESREFVYVTDAIAGTALAALTPAAKGEVIHLGSGNNVTIGELGQKIVALGGYRSKLLFEPRRSWDAVTRRQTSSEKARRILGYEATTGFDEGLRKTWEWINDPEVMAGAREIQVLSVPPSAERMAERATAGND